MATSILIIKDYAGVISSLTRPFGVLFTCPSNFYAFDDVFAPNSAPLSSSIFSTFVFFGIRDETKAVASYTYCIFSSYVSNELVV